MPATNRSDERRHDEREASVALADITLDNDPQRYRLKVRNISPAGLMGEGPVRVERGARVTLELGETGPVTGPITGSVAWVQDDRFGVAFDEHLEAG